MPRIDPATIDLPHRFEMAVMALTIKKARQTIDKKSGGGFFGRTALQKTMYFLERSGVPLPYRFEIHLYGPFCSEVYHDVDCLEATHVVEDRARETGKYWNYAPGFNADAFLEGFQEELAPHERTIKQIVSVFSGFQPESLELIATLDYLYQDEAARAGRSPDKSKVVDRFMRVKKKKFEKSAVEKTYDVLLEAKIFKSRAKA
jgi:uncharacterized protein YwgA